MKSAFSLVSGIALLAALPLAEEATAAALGVTQEPHRASGISDPDSD